MSVIEFTIRSGSLGWLIATSRGRKLPRPLDRNSSALTPLGAIISMQRLHANDFHNYVPLPGKEN
jgi:hypothetical protein